MKKGISLVVLITTIAIMLILITTLTISALNTSNNSQKISFGMEISTIEQSVNSYVISNDGEYPVSNSVLLNTNNITQEALKQFTDNNEIIGNDGNILVYQIDYSKINHENLKFGTGKDGSTDMYVVSKATGKVYYAKGVKIGDNTYYTITDEINYLLGFNKDKNIENTNPAIVFIPSDTSWTNQNVQVVVKVPKKYSISSIKAGENTISKDITQSNIDSVYDTYIANNEGNYQIIIEYKINSSDNKTITSRYSVNNVDKTAPEISIDVDNQILLSQSDGNIVGYVKILSKSDDLSGIKKIKYDEANINTDIKQHFQVAGKDIKNDTVVIYKQVRDITVYIEDNAGNAKAVSFKVNVIKPTAYNYIQDGLIANFDGENNTGNGHSNNTTTWKDLSGNNNDAKNTNTATTWEDNNYYFVNANTNYFETINNINFGTNPRTVEVVFKLDTLTSMNLFGMGNAVKHQMMDLMIFDNALNCHIYNNTAKDGISNSVEAGKIYSSTFTYENLVAGYRTNDTYKPSVAFYSDFNTAQTTLNIGTGKYDPYNVNNPFRIYSLRIYNRALTKAEIEHNYKIDKQRFNI